jgi:hypothetical protein
MPYKLKEAMRHKFEKSKYRVSNWREYNESLRNMGSLTIWFSDEAISGWYHDAAIKQRGGQQVYSDLTIMT